MLSWLIDRFRRRRRVPVVAAVTQKPETSTAPAVPSMTEMLYELISGIGGPATDLDEATWRGLAADVGERTDSVPAPSSFSIVASQTLAMLRDPDVDINRLVGVVQRDAGIATALLRIANSPAFAPSVAVTSLRGAVNNLGTRAVVEIVVGNAGRSYYEVSSRAELALFPDLWKTMFLDATTNAFTAGWLALEVRGASSDRALLGGLLADFGRSLALRIVSRMILEGAPRPDESVVIATIEACAPEIGRSRIGAMKLPDELREACSLEPAAASPDAQIARLVSTIGAIQRRSPRTWSGAAEVRDCAEKLGLDPYKVRTVFAQRLQFAQRAAAMFGA
jgi:HD-like signal output (HDOD) protein